MQPADEFRDKNLVKSLVCRINRDSNRPINLMEFCGSHTAAILKAGLRQLLPPDIHLLSGPGCPVCVTDQADIDMAVSLSRQPGIILTTFGDMLKVPGSGGSLSQATAEGADVRTVYSTLDALQIAIDNPDRSVVFLGVGFETTAPTIAASIKQANRAGINNYSVLCLAKICPPVMKALLDGGEIAIDGIICPGHVSAVIGSRPYRFIPEEYGIACVVAGFEPVDIMSAIEMLVKQVQTGQPTVEIAYKRAVSEAGNLLAQELMEEVFETVTARWRGVGEVPASGLAIKDEFYGFDARKLFDIRCATAPSPEHRGCRCGDVLRGIIVPPECGLFKHACTPEHPLGPCMVSAEGACSSYFLYGD